jgi:ribonuclease D
MKPIEPLTDDPRHAQRLLELAQELAEAAAIGMDTEFLRERTYRPQLCLLQLATPTRCECIDPLGQVDFSPFRPALTSAMPVKILHAARQDLEVLWPLFGAVTPVFDTQIAAALCGMPAQVGYGELVRRLIGVEIDKSHTRTDWSRRPLSTAQLAYAVDDVRYLAPLRDALLEQLDRLGRRIWLEEELRPLATEASLFVDPERAYERLKGVLELDSDRQRLAQRLAAWRERRASDRNRPRAWILDDAGLRALLAVAPRSVSALQALPELTAGFIENSGTDILRVIEEAGLPTHLPPLPGRPRPDALFNDCVKKLGSAVRDAATQLSIAPELLATRRDLEQIARGERDVPPLQGWRRGVVGDALLAAL